MTQYQEDDDPDSEMPTFAVAKQQQKEHIAQLRKGDKGERRLAKLLTQCHKGNRCNLIECLVCERRKMLRKWEVPAPVIKSMIGTKTPKEIYLNGIEVVDKRRPLNEEKVRAMAASMDQIGLQMPITVRMQKKKVILVSGSHRLAAAKRLGWDAILCVELCGDKIDARLWQLMENLYRAELTVLERAVEELRTLVQAKSKGGQVAPPGGQQPKDAGIKKTAKALGVRREEVRRSKAIAGISPKAKKAAKSAKLDNSQRALLEIAKLPTPNAQLRAVKEIVERKRAERARYASAAKQKATAEIAALKAGLTKDKRTREKAEGNIAYKRQRLRELKDVPAADYGDLAITVTSPLTALSQDQGESATDPPLNVELLTERHNAEVEDLQKRIRELEVNLSTARQSAPSPLVDAASLSAGVGDLERRALSEEEQRQADELEHVFANASPLVRQRFLAKYAGSSASTTQASTSSNIH